MIFLFSLITFTTTALANDTASMGTASNVSFVANKNVVIHREDLTIGPMRHDNGAHVPIVVKYSMENMSSVPDPVQMAFPIPGCHFEKFFKAMIDSRVSAADSCVKMPEMKVKVDGKIESSGKWIRRFLMRGVLFDESEFSKRTGVKSADLSNLLDSIPELSDEKQEQAEKKFEDTVKRLCKKLGGTSKGYLGHECDPMKKLWAENVFVWSHEFRPKKKTEIVHEYQVEASWNVDWRDRFDHDVFCLKDPSVLKAWEKNAEISAPFIHHNFVGYILKTGGNWAKPIEEFNLTLRKKDKEQLVSTCFNGLKKMGPLEFKATRKNFLPTEDLYVLFFYAANLGRWRGDQWVPSKE